MKGTKAQEQPRNTERGHLCNGKKVTFIIFLTYYFHPVNLS
jgi:hypothetical protein